MIQVSHATFNLNLKDSNFESFKLIRARFAGGSWESFLTISFGEGSENQQNLPFLMHNDWAFKLGYEQSFESINKTFELKSEREKEIYFGLIKRQGRGFFDLRIGGLRPKISVLDISGKENIKLDIDLARVIFRYAYFLN